jgi:hypothetical protein
MPTTLTQADLTNLRTALAIVIEAEVAGEWEQTYRLLFDKLGKMRDELDGRYQSIYAPIKPIEGWTMEQSECKSLLLSAGWKEDQWGHMKNKSVNGEMFRVKFEKISLRVEKQHSMTHGLKSWINIQSVYYSDTQTPNVIRSIIERCAQS